MNKRDYIAHSFHELFAVWLRRACLWGALLFVLFSSMDYVATPESFWIFLGYRAVASLCLLVVAFLASQTRKPPFLYLLAVVAVIISVGTLELMILSFGGHASPYYVGIILVAICVFGFVPGPFLLHIALAVSIYGLYLVPIFIFDKISDFRFFFMSNFFLISVLCSGLLLRYLNDTHLVKRDLSLKFDLIRSEDRFRLAFENAPLGMALLDPSGRFVQVNQSLCRMLGHSKESLKALKISAIVPAQEPPIRTDCPVRTEASAPPPAERRLLRADGSTVWGRISLATVAWNQESAPHTVIEVEDVTARKRAEEDRARLMALVESTSDLIALISPSGQFLYMNKAGRKLLGVPGDLDIRDIALLDPGLFKDLEQMRTKIIRAVVSEGTWHGDFTLRRANTEQQLQFSMGSFLVTDPGDPVATAVAVIGRDVTHSRAVEEELFRAKKLEALGVLAGGVAHDFNNILTGIVGNITLAQQVIGEKSPAHARLASAERESFHARDLAQRLLTFSRGGTPVREPRHVKDLVEGAAALSLKGCEVETELSLPDGLWSVDVDEGQILRAVNHVIVNAVQAMSERGVLRISAENVEESSKRNPSAPSGKYVRVSIADEGHGIREEDLPKIFDPYFTTKRNGTGLGLAEVHSIVRKHGGFVSVDSTRGAGTVFHLYLPASQSTEVRAGPKAPKSGTPTVGGRRILLMDDQETIRDVAAELLKGLGYDVETAKDGGEAFSLYARAKRQGRPFAAVIADLTVPGGMGAEELIKALLEIDPDVKALVSSGYSDDPITGNYAEHGFQGVLPKPYRLEDLRDKLAPLTGSPA